MPAGVDGGRALLGQVLFHRGRHLLDREAEQPGGDAERDHVGAPVRNALGEFLERNFDDAGAGLAHGRRRLAAVGVADHQGLRAGLDFRAETVGIEPVDADQEVESVRHALDRVVGQPQQRRRLAAADLRARACGSSSPCQPAELAASSRKLPVVSAPAPPLPMTAIEMLEETSMDQNP